MSEQLFVMVSTGQNVANLPPVLEMANPGDYFLWIESPKAAAEQWSSGSTAVLKSFGLIAEKPIRVEELNDPSQIVQACKPRVGAYVEKKLNVILVANGGMKLTPIGLSRAWEAAKPLMIYGYDIPSCYWVYESGDTPAFSKPFERHRLDLNHILQARGYQIVQNSGQQIWPATQQALSLSNERYGFDETFTRAFHLQHWQWGSSKPAFQEHLSYEKAKSVVGPEETNKWQQSVYATFSAGACSMWAAIQKRLPPKLAIPKPNPAVLYDQKRAEDQSWAQTAYHAALKLSDNARSRLAQADFECPNAPIGSVFESYVAHRALQWIQNSSAKSVIQSIWFNVKVAKCRSLGKVEAEMDLLFVLKNAVLVHLECKTFTVDNKDLDARMLNLQLASSSLAKMAICAPIYTSMAQEPWFKSIHKYKTNIEDNLRFKIIPMTLPGQPASYQNPDPGQPSSISVPSFEKSMDQLFAPYMPRSQSKEVVSHKPADKSNADRKPTAKPAPSQTASPKPVAGLISPGDCDPKSSKIKNLAKQLKWS